MPKLLDIVGNGVREVDGTFTFELKIKGIESEEHCRAIGQAIEPRVQEAIAAAVKAKAKIIIPH